LYLEAITNLSLAHNTRTLSILETPLTSPLEEHQEGLEDLEDLEDPMIPSVDQMVQEQYPPLISFPYNPPEI